MLEFPSQLEIHPDSPVTTQEESQSVSGNERGGLTTLRNHESFTVVPVFSRKEPRVSYCNLSKTTGFHLQCKMMPDSPGIASRAILCSTSNTKGGLTSFMELQRVPRNTVTSLEEPRDHCRNPKELRVHQIISR